MKKRFLFKSLVLMALMIVCNVNAAQAAEKTAKAVWVQSNTTLTFYYDATKHSGTTYNIPETVATKEKDIPWYSNCRNNATTVVFDASFKNYKPKSTAFWFSSCAKLTTITGTENLNTEEVTSMTKMFNGCKLLTSIDVSKLNPANVTDMSYMFYNCNALSSLDLSGFNTANVTDMNHMFHQCKALSSLDLSGFNTANVTDMSYTFAECNALTSLDVSKFNTAKVTNMNCMFNNCYLLDSLNVSNFNTENVTNMTAMFSGCKKLASLNLSNFNTDKVTKMGSMFSFCQTLTSLDVSNFNTANVTTMSGMFNYCQALTSLDVSNFNTANVTNMYLMFAYCMSLTSLDLSNFNTANVTNMSCMFQQASLLTAIYVSDKWNTGKVTSSDYMFTDCIVLKGGNGTGYNSSNVTHAYACIDKAGTPGYLTGKISMAIGETGLATLYADYKLTVPEGVSVYGLADHGTYLNYSNAEAPAAGAILPANQGYIVKGTNGMNYIFSQAKDEAAEITSCLSGVTVDTLASKVTGGTIYTLANGTNGIGFYKFAGDSLKANKAFYLAPSAQTAKEFIGIGEATGINDVDATSTSSATDKIYNLQGVCVGKNYRGIVIMKGKKVLR